MAVELFQKNQFSLVYQKYMVPISSEVVDLILSYMEEKKCKSFKLALDVGCGTGRYTRSLAPLFQKVLATDISESQINEAKISTSEKNVFYQLAPAEQLPLEDASVDLVNAGLAAHWFTIDKFLQEAVRVLKPNGCLAVHAFYPAGNIEYEEFSETLTALVKEVWDILFKYVDKTTEHMLCQYKGIFKAVPLTDKQRVTDIPVTFPMTLGNLMGFIQSVYMYQAFLEQDSDGAKEFLIKTEHKFRDILGEAADLAVFKMHMKHYCVLACKS
ncbi:putative methyltransferase DDB_G0268948 [Ascaphus truei]|uniref:putative methyltransferase DDB_G0268948 n=1 Tax=Ascaphus truei TaxID=8439 RepID=UPI003F5A7D89